MYGWFRVQETTRVSTLVLLRDEIFVLHSRTLSTEGGGVSFFLSFSLK